MPFDAGMRFERGKFLELMATPESKALRHAFFAERAASRVADVPESTPARTIERVAVIGAARWGAGSRSRSPMRAAGRAGGRGSKVARARRRRAAARGRKLKPEDIERRMSLVRPRPSLDDSSDRRPRRRGRVRGHGGQA
jgi:3-hydroxyacyl-CoA dehydrogenase